MKLQKSCMSTVYKITGDEYSYLLPVLKAIIDVTNESGIDFVVIGATARDFLIESVFQVNLNCRATKDVDFAIMIDNWEAYENVVQILKEKFNFEDHPQKQRLLFNSLPVDIIPFGSIAIDGEISWPPDGSIQMNVSGFEEVFESSLICERAGIQFHVANLEGFFISKIIAWSDRKVKMTKDAEDIGVILYNYNDFYTGDLFEDNIELIDRPDYDYIKTGAILLGKRLKRILNNSSRLKEEIIAILQQEIVDKEGSLLAQNLSNNKSFDENFVMIELFYKEIIT